MKTLCILSHMDDETLSCGGLIMKRLNTGHDVHVLIVFGRRYNYGEGDQHVDEQFADFRNAMKLLGDPPFNCYGLEEGEPQEQGYYRVLRIIEEMMERQDPEEVVIQSHVDLNQDHRWLADCSRIALRPANLRNVKRILVAHGIDGHLTPGVNFYIPMTGVDVQQKIEAMVRYKRESRDIPHPRAPSNLVAYHRLVGSQCGYEFAEPYTCIFSKE